MKVLIMSHASDADGITPVILSKLVFDDIDYLLFENAEVENEVRRRINNHDLDKYDIIFITDLLLSQNIYNLIDSNLELKNKIQIFDHHPGSLFATHYPYTTIVDTNEDGQRESATSIFYKYLIKNYNCDILSKDSIEQFVELVRSYDVWEWKEKNNIKAKQLANLFTIYGNEYFIEYYLEYFNNNDTFSFNDKELFLLTVEDRRIKNYIERKKKKVIPATYDNYNIGIVFATQYRSELGNTLAEYYKDIYDFIVIIDIEGNISYRGIKDIYLNEIASIFGGGGHKDSAGSPIPYGIREKVIKLIFNDKFKLKN